MTVCQKLKEEVILFAVSIHVAIDASVFCHSE
jgi:hypothetical protein